MTIDKFFVYIVETAKGNLYTGISNKVKTRIREHNKGKGAKCLRGQLPVTLLWQSYPGVTKSEALKKEAQIKKLSRLAKLVFLGEEKAKRALS